MAFANRTTNTFQLPPVWREFLWMSFASALVVVSLIALQWDFKHPYANDSSGYIQEGQGLLEGRGLTRGAAWDDFGNDFVAFPLFPPGFSFLITGGSLLGLATTDAALLASWLAWWLVAPAVFWATNPLIGRWPACGVALLAVASPGFVEWGYQALSDAPMILASLLSLGMLTRLQAITTPAMASWVLSGVFASAAYLFRNAGAVLPISVILVLGGAWLLRRLGFVPMLRAGLAWGGGFALFAFPLFAYNQMVFGSIQPYFGMHGTVDYGLLHAFRLTLWSLLLDVAAWRAIADLAWNGAALLIIASFVVGLTWMLRRHVVTLPFAGWLLLVYGLAGCALIVWGRSRFDWVETTLTRQIMPYSWALLTLGVWALAHIIGRHGRMLLWFAFACLALGRAVHVGKDYARDLAIRDSVSRTGYVATAAAHPDWLLTPRIKRDIAADVDLMTRLRALPVDAHIVSNQGALLSVASGRVVRSAPLDAANFAALRDPCALVACVVVAVLTNTRLHQPGAARWQDDFLALAPDAAMLYRSPRALALRLP